MGIFEKYAEAKNRELQMQQDMYGGVSDYFFDNEGAGLADAAARTVGDTVSGVPGMFDAVGNFIGETYDTGGTNISDAAMSLYNNPELRNKLSINSMVTDTTDAMGRAYEGDYPDTKEGSDERFDDYLASLGVLSGGALATGRVAGDVMGLVKKAGTPETPNTPTDPSRREFGQKAAAAALTAAVSPSLLGSLAKKTAVGTATAGAVTGFGSSLARLRGLNAKFEKSFDDIAGDDPGDGNYANDMIDSQLNELNDDLMKEKTEVMNDLLGADYSPESLKDLSNMEFRELEGTIRDQFYRDYNGNQITLERSPSREAEIDKINESLRAERARRGLETPAIRDPNAALKDFMQPPTKAPDDIVGQIMAMQRAAQAKRK